MSTAAESGFLARATGFKVFACLAFAYLLSYVLRTINAAIAPELVSEFSLSNADLGSLSSAYFLAFALMQLPLGVWLDRYGTRRTNSALLLVAALGCVLFGLADAEPLLWLARAMIGAGFAGALMGSLRAFRFWFPADRQQQLIAWMLVVGSTGALLASAPSRALIPVIGWRGLFLLAGGLLVVASVAIFWFLPRVENVQKNDQKNKPSSESVAAPVTHGFAGYLTVYRNRYFWRFAVLSVVMQSSFIAFQSLWIGPWFTEVMQQSAKVSGQVIFGFNLVLLLAFVALGSIARKMNQRGVSLLRVCQVTTVMIIGLHLWLSFTDSIIIAVGTWFVYAIVATPYTLLQSHVGMSFPEAITGRAYTGFNLLVFAGIFLIQWIFGALVDWCLLWRETEPQAFRLAMQIWVGVEVLALLWFTFFKARPLSETAVS